METRNYFGQITPHDLANRLVSEFHAGNLRTQIIGAPEKLVVQIATRDHPQSGGTTALSVSIWQRPEGISVQVGEQSWLGVAASLGQTALFAAMNPWNLISRLDDIAQDLEHLQLANRIWSVIEETVKKVSVATEITNRLRNVICPYCTTGNPVGQASCIACGAPLGNFQPSTCFHCGFVVRKTDTICPNCRKPL